MEIEVGGRRSIRLRVGGQSFGCRCLFDRGELVGELVGLALGELEGTVDGLLEGAVVGELVGELHGEFEGEKVRGTRVASLFLFSFLL